MMIWSAVTKEVPQAYGTEIIILVGWALNTHNQLTPQASQHMCALPNCQPAVMSALLANTTIPYMGLGSSALASLLSSRSSRTRRKSRVLDQNGIYQACHTVEIYHSDSGLDPSKSKPF